MQPSIFILAGEQSGDNLGAVLLKEFSNTGAEYRVWGVGGAAMMEQGFASILPINSFSIIGFVEAIRALARMRRLANMLVDRIIAERPTAVLTIDSKGFSMMLARRLRKRMKAVGWYAPIIHLVAPTVWAWGEWRAKSIAKLFDHLLCVFPFEPPYFIRHGLGVTFTGHPIADKPVLSKSKARGLLNIKKDTPVLVLLPGSRTKEVKSLLPDMLGAAAILKADLPHLKVLLPVAESVKDTIEEITGRVAGRVAGGADAITVIEEDSFEAALASGDYAMICSGTATLQAALAGSAGDVYYRVGSLNYLLARLICKFDNPDEFVLANIVAGKPVYNMYVNSQFSASTMAAKAQPYLEGKAGKTIENTAIRASLVSKDGFAKTTVQAILGVIASYDNEGKSNAF